jgi:hypothetical protein
MPPILEERIEWRIRVGIEVESLWKQTANVLPVGGMLLSAYANSGLPFTLNDKGSVRATAKMDDGSPAAPKTRSTAKSGLFARGARGRGSFWQGQVAKFRQVEMKTFKQFVT